MIATVWRSHYMKATVWRLCNGQRVMATIWWWSLWDIHSVIATGWWSPYASTVWWPSYGYDRMRPLSDVTEWWPLYDGYSEMVAVWWPTHDGHSEMATVWWLLCDDKSDGLQVITATEWCLLYMVTVRESTSWGPASLLSALSRCE